MHRDLSTEAESRALSPATATIDQEKNAGNAGDVLKHAVLAAVVTATREAGRALLHLETHAGRGEYRVKRDPRREHLWSPLPLVDESITAPYSAVLRARLAPSPKECAYPGSPLVAAHAAGRDWAGAILYEHDREAARSLASVVGALPHTVVHPRSAFEGADPHTLWAEPLTWPMPAPAMWLPLLLVDPFQHAPDAGEDALLSGVLNRGALTLAVAGLRELRRPAEGVVMVWTHRALPALCADLGEALGAEVSVGDIRDGKRRRPYHVVLGGLGPVGRAVVERVVSADWIASPLLRAWGFQIDLRAGTS